MPSTSSTSGQPKVSVVIPNYNHGGFLDQRFATVLGQTFQDFEVLFLDDASSDDSRTVFGRYSSHPKVARAILNDQNSGSPYKQWNSGARQARGEYLWIAESDDYADPRFLERMVGVLDAMTNVGIAFCKSIKVDEQSNVIGTSDDWLADLGPRWAGDFVAGGREECGADLMRRCVIPNVSSALIRMTTLAEIGYAHEAMRFCGDYFTYAKLLEVSDLAYVSAPMNYFRFSSRTMRSKMSHSWLHEYERAQVIAYVDRTFGISAQARELAAQEYVSKLVRTSLHDWRLAGAFISRFASFRAAAATFCPAFTAECGAVAFRIAKSYLVNRLPRFRS